MSEPKSFASLSSTLLARKGEAKPAMRSQAINLSHTVARDVSDDDHHDDLGWNDMGHDLSEHENPRVMPSPINGHVSPQVDNVAPPPVIQQQAELAREFAPPPAVVAPVAPVAPIAPVVVEAAPPKAPRAAAGTKGKAAFTLRLDGERHLKLRLVCAVNHRSAQQIVTQALDEFLARQPSVAELVRRGGGTPD